MISCIITTKNRREQVKNAIYSVIGQTWPIDEIVVVDDGSVDGTSDMIQREYPFVRIVMTEGAGPGEARNAGILASSCDVVMFLDSDDVWLPDHANHLISRIQNGFQVAYGITQNYNQLNGDEFYIPDKRIGISGNCFHAIAKWCFTVPSSVAVTRNAFDQVGGFPDLPMGEDWAFLIKAASLFEFGFAEQLVTTRYLHSGSLCSSENLSKKILMILKNIKRILSEISITTERDLYFIRQAIPIVSQKGDKWTTFQDFYAAVRKKGLL